MWVGWGCGFKRQRVRGVRVVLLKKMAFEQRPAGGEEGSMWFSGGRGNSPCEGSEAAWNGPLGLQETM